jgi:uncharacterized protein (DUF1015 family)
VDEDDIQHRLWRLTERSAVATCVEALRDRAVIIADGHHRYETAVNFRDERRAEDAAPPEVERRRPHNFVLTCLVGAEEPGLVILPTHRVIRQRPAREGAALRQALARHFRVATAPLDPGNPVMSLRIVLADLSRRRHGAVVFGLYAGGQEVMVLELTDTAVIDRLVADGHSPEYARLDVVILHRLVIEQILGIQPTGHADDGIAYLRDEAQTLAAVASGEAHVALFQNPPRVEQVQAVAMAGERMPQKSTFFYPKLLSGLVINPLDAGEPTP